jgi:2-polyprenyl-6-methoxyphenol hydroxylase-like FAD-dependent oxidoreductase
VLNGGSPLALTFEPPGSEALGRLAANHLIRKALFEGIENIHGVTVRAGATVANVTAGRGGCVVTLENGERIAGRLLIAADSRFSAVRDQLGIGARMNRLGKAMLVARVEHDRSHGGVATEWFEHGHTIAMLPLGEYRSSAVLTVGLDDAARLRDLGDEALAAEIAARFRHGWGRCGWPAAATSIRW